MVTAGSGDSRPPVVAVVGPTAAGKTELSLDLAKVLGGEIVNTDAMQVYRGMDIGTAKVPPAERRGIPHHLLDVLDVTEPATVAEFQRLPRGGVGGGPRRRRGTGAGGRLGLVHPSHPGPLRVPGHQPGDSGPARRRARSGRSRRDAPPA